MKIFAYHGYELLWIVAAMNAEEAKTSSVVLACCRFRSVWGDQIARDVRHNEAREVLELRVDHIRWADEITPHDEHELHEQAGSLGLAEIDNETE